MTSNNLMLRMGCGIFLTAALSACSHTPPQAAYKATTPLVGAVKAKQRADVDGAPDVTLTAEEIAQLKDAIPVDEPLSKYGNNSPYTVLGETYKVLNSAKGFKQVGRASWYGRKFHGQRTSSGEQFDMYRMTAAHKNLPIPCYAKVTNLDNGKTAIVKVNDRGPFHAERVMDVSWAAAAKLDMLGSGTANISFEVINPADYLSPKQAVASSASPEPTSTATTAVAAATPASTTKTVDGHFYVQAGAFGSKDNASALQTRLLALASGPVEINSTGDAIPVHRVQVGPFDDEASAERVRGLLRDPSFGVNPIIVKR